MSGHNKWSKIKRAKGAADAKRSKQWSNILKQVTIAVREGGPDPDSNPRLRLLVQNARGCNMPKDTLQRSINKANDKDAAQMQELTFECHVSHGIALFIEALSDNNNRTVNLSFAGNSDFTSASNYTFEFDLALVSGSANASTVSVIGSNGTLCNITFAGKASTATVTNGSGTTLGSIACDPYLSSHATISSTYYPSQFYHFTITGNSSGVKLTVTRNGSTIINSATLSSSFATIQSLQNVLGRWYSHVAYDNITLTSLVSVNAKAASFDVEEAEEEATAINEAPAETKAPVVIGYTTLDGRPVQTPVPGTIYLERKSDGTVRKVLFR